ncbi:MAG: hypothetical protein LBE92_17260 [Chryseobacterium sp.]|jgi:hypothetical protein|uniref:XAC2610-related protein n=1 Tax=Chryseobacterium sp. TaxID=1871047 RepID=UPI00281B4F92|nr:hypothetical protein [Chryseobacterium sp.]MDR2237875.1 hypothetical protein [Chryseobacterium sp.]
MKNFIFILLLPLFWSAQQIRTDDIYPKENISISLDKIKEADDETSNYQLKIYKNKKLILKDLVYSKVGEFEFEDFNGDGIKDLLIQNISDVRSNWTYSLYLFDPKNKTFKKVLNFESIKNPVYQSKHNWIESYTVSGANYLSFYRIVGNRIRDLNYTIHDNDSVNFENEYQRAVKKFSK